MSLFLCSALWLWDHEDDSNAKQLFPNSIHTACFSVKWIPFPTDLLSSLHHYAYFVYCVKMCENFSDADSISSYIILMGRALIFDL